MREIKFRAYLKDFKEMKYLIGIVNFHKENITIFCNDLNTTVMTRDCNIMQYAGIKDKNGKEIYEGDIIKYADNESMSNWCRGEIALIVFENGAFLGRMKPFNRNEGDNQNRLYENDSDSREIIGNIYEATEEQLKEWKIEK
jgi:uncharacterized phage protein (TIGR01671 family)